MCLSRWTIGVTLVLGLLVVMPGTVRAEDGAPGQSPIPAAVDVGSQDGRVTLDVVERPLKDVIDYIRVLTEVNLFVSPEAEAQTVTIQVRSMPWRTFLGLVAEKTGCVLDMRDPSVVKIERPPYLGSCFEPGKLGTYLLDQGDAGMREQDTS